MRKHALIALVTLVTLGACDTPPPHMQAWRDAGTAEPLKQSTRYVAYSAAWRAKAEAAYRKASAHVDTFVAKHPNTSWAVVADLDQTVMNNIAYQIELDKRGAEFTPETWRAWVEAREATLIPGAAAFISKVNMLGGKVVFVSNRRDYEVAATEMNLAAHGLDKGVDYAAIIPRAWPDEDSDKEARFAAVPDMLGGAKVIAYVGDVVGDKPATLGCAKFFCIPQGGLYGENCH